MHASGIVQQLIALSIDNTPQNARLKLNHQQIKHGDVFFAYPGTSTDGRHYINQAIKNGARAIVYDPDNFKFESPLNCPAFACPQLSEKLSDIAGQFYQNPSKNMQIIGITGTNGKTSCCFFIAQLLSLLGRRVAIMGTIGTGIWPDLTPATLTTNDPLSLQAQLACWQDNVDYVVMEVSSHALAQHRVNGIAIDTAVFTHLSQDHLDYHHTLTNYAQAKARLFALPSVTTAIINLKDPYAHIMQAAVHTKATIYDSSDYPRFLKIDQHTGETYFTWRGIQAKWSLIGTFQLDNLGTALSVIERLGYDIKKILSDPVSRLRPVPGRMECIHSQPTVIIDFAHTPDAIATILKNIRPYVTGTLWCVFGPSGDRDRSKRALMAQAAECGADAIILTLDNPRFEDPKQIIADTLKGFSQPDVVTVIPDRGQALNYALQHLQNTDTLVILGKGHERSLHIAGKQAYFNEPERVKQYFLEHAL